MMLKIVNNDLRQVRCQIKYAVILWINMKNEMLWTVTEMKKYFFSWCFLEMPTRIEYWVILLSITFCLYFGFWLCDDTITKICSRFNPSWRVLLFHLSCHSIWRVYVFVCGAQNVIYFESCRNLFSFVKEETFWVLS